jgi:hypothetical protein
MRVWKRGRERNKHFEEARENEERKNRKKMVLEVFEEHEQRVEIGARGVEDLESPS